ncbi:hypothetical protein U9M48_042604 [Paspalum notatum var. saurae]|uniref:DUF659 domain-containing protein n=1 Tax=Paspalum notatum var. saurae TaxID=547442 RepID=A0AAQ3USX4_PASNO
MLQVHAKGRKSRADAKERRLFVEKAILEEAYGDARRANIPNDKAGQIEWALRESLRGHGAQGSSPPLDRSSTRASNSTPPIDRARFSGTQTTMDRFCRSPSVSNALIDIDLERSKMPSQPRVDIMLQEGAKEKLEKALAKWFHANDIPGRKADCPYFVAAIKLAQQLGDVSIPKGKDIDGPLLDMNYDDLCARMDDYKENWGRFGVTIMCDSWTGPTMMCIINFMIFCNGRMFFHKTVDATGYIQNADFIYDCITEVVVGSNYKNACKQLTAKYQHISWQPCAAHAINLMLKDIARFDEVDELLYGAKRMCRLFYKHNRLHAMMKEKIGGELVRWNATRFGTLFMFLRSFWERQEKFQAWMVSSDWKNNDWRHEDDHKFTYDCLTDRIWWDRVDMVLKAVTPLYSVLRFADQQKNGTISRFIPRMLSAQAETFAKLKHDRTAPTDFIRRKLASSPSEASAIDQFTKIFSQRQKLFGSIEARSSALRGATSAGQCKELQRIATRIVSQCSSSSGCERNWSTFALVHTKLRARLGYEKLEKLVFVYYNLKLYIQQFEAETSQQKETDPYSMMMDVALFDENNPIMDWFCNSRSESRPILDEYDDDDDDWTAPGSFLIEKLQMNETDVAAFKRELCFGRNGREKKRKRQLEEEEMLDDDFHSDSSHGSPIYAESNDSSSTSEDEGDAPPLLSSVDAQSKARHQASPPPRHVSSPPCLRNLRAKAGRRSGSDPRRATASSPTPGGTWIQWGRRQRHGMDQARRYHGAAASSSAESPRRSFSPFGRRGPAA